MISGVEKRVQSPPIDVEVHGRPQILHHQTPNRQVPLLILFSFFQMYHSYFQIEDSTFFSTKKIVIK